MIRSISDEAEGLCFKWAPASMPLPDPPGSAGVVALAGPYMPLQGSLLPDTELEDMPVQLSLPEKVCHQKAGFYIESGGSGAIGAACAGLPRLCGQYKDCWALHALAGQPYALRGLCRGPARTVQQCATVLRGSL